MIRLDTAAPGFAAAFDALVNDRREADADVAPPARIVLCGHVGGLGHRHAAMADAEIDGRIELGIGELHQHVGSDDAELRGAVRDEGRDVEGADADQVDVGPVGGEAQRPAVLVREGGLGHDSRRGEQRQRLGQDAAFRHGDDEWAFHGTARFTWGAARVQQGGTYTALKSPREPP